MSDVRITAAGDGIYAAGRRKAQVELLEAATAALAWLDLFDQHAPSDWVFGGEAEVRGLLRDAIRQARAEDRDWDDAEDLAEAQALDALRRDLGRAPTERERLAFLNGYRERRAQLLGKVRGWEAPAAR